MSWVKQGGSSTVIDWLSLPEGANGDVNAVNVDGELCVAARGPVVWSLRSPSNNAKNYVISNRMPSGAISWYSNSAMLSPGGLNLQTTTSGNEAHTIPLHLYDGVDIGSIELLAWNTNGVAYDIRRAYIGAPNCPAVITEDISTGFVTLIGSDVSVNRLGTQQSPKLVSIGEVNTPGLVGDFTLFIEVGNNAEKRDWGSIGLSVGYGTPLNGTNWTTQMAATVPSSGTFAPYTYNGFSSAILPNIAVRCKSLSRQFIQPLIVGDSIAQGYGSQDSFLGKSGFAKPWFDDWESNNLPYIPLQLGWQGFSSTQIRSLLQAILVEVGTLPTFLEAATINNWNEGFNLADPGANNLADLTSNIETLNNLGIPYWLWTGFGWDIIGSTGRSQMRSTYNTIQSLYPTGLYGAETCGVMNIETMLYLSNMTLDGGHPNQAGWSLFSASNLSGATSALNSLS